jgi:hypothetical protein
MSNETVKAIDSLLSTSSSTNEIKMNVQFNALTFSIIASSAFGQSFETILGAKESMSHAFNEQKEVIAYRSITILGVNE